MSGRKQVELALERVSIIAFCGRSARTLKTPREPRRYHEMFVISPEEGVSHAAKGIYLRELLKGSTLVWLLCK